MKMNATNNFVGNNLLEVPLMGAVAGAKRQPRCFVGREFRRRISAVVAAVILSASLATAAEVNLRLSSREAFVGSPVYVQISIDNASTHEKPQLPNIPGLRIHAADTPSRSSQVMTINGKTTRRESVTYSFELTPTRPGRFVIPAIAVQADGKKFATAAAVFVATKSETGDLLFVEIAGERKSVYIGQPLKLNLRIWVKPYFNREYKIKLSAGDMWNLISQRSDWGWFAGAFEEMARNRRRPQGREVLRKDSTGVERSYYLYEIGHTVWPKQAGGLRVGDIFVRMMYPTGLARSEGIFSMGELTISGTRPLVKTATVEPIEVKAVPTTNRPGGYHGAVGQFEITASALPREVYVGDPITLKLVIRGTGRMDTLSAPKLSELPELTKDFKVPSEKLPGIVQGDRKFFSVSLRAKHEGVKAIPPIPLVYFDPQTQRFATASTKPIPLTVKPADAMAMSKIVSAAKPDDGKPGESDESKKPQFNGIEANYSTADVLAGGSNMLVRPGLWLAIGVPPLLFAGLLIGKKLHGIRNDGGYSRRRGAHKNALRQLAQAEDADTVAATAIQYIADRLDKPAAGMTRGDAVEALRSHGASEDAIAHADDLLGKCEHLRFAGGNHNAAAELAAQTRRCLERLEKEGLKNEPATNFS
ncbi:MAG: BatD family protein [Phycisphaerae bacterium]|nr:BatD family protein [Phycisphaerae bacterium]